MTEKQNLVQWVYSSRDEKELGERYDQWASSYEKDLIGDFGWYGPSSSVIAAGKYVPKDSRILDAGAGTGLVGQLLNEQGYHNLVAMDLSEGMLNQARRKNVYGEFHQMVMGENLGFPTDSFDAVLSVGVLTVGHAPASSLSELVRVVRPGGHIIFTLRPDLYEDGGFKEVQTALESEGTWKLVEMGDPMQALPKGEPDVLHQVWVYEVTS